MDTKLARTRAEYSAAEPKAMQDEILIEHRDEIALVTIDRGSKRHLQRGHQ